MKQLLPLLNKKYIALLLAPWTIMGFCQTGDVYEAEHASLSGTAMIVDCNTASGGQMVKDLSSGKENSLLFDNISVTEAGEYYITVSYLAANDRQITYELNDLDLKTLSIQASGLWCYQGGLPADFSFLETLEEGSNKFLFYDSPIIDKIEISKNNPSNTNRQASAIYISSSSGSDENDGLTPETAFRTIDKLNSLALLPGDSLLFMSGDTFTGRLSILNEGGTDDLPVLITSYGSGNKPVLDGNGFLATIYVLNSGYLHFSNLEIKNDGGLAQPGESEKLRYGIYIQNQYNDGTVFEHYRLNNLTFKNIYPEINVSDDDRTGVHGHAIITSGSWGDEIHPSRFRDMIIENCYFTRTARHAAVFKAVDSLEISNNLFEHVGGAGMVIGNNCTNILVENNITDHTGSSIDERMAGRGSGLWCYRTKNLIAQHNQFLYARGIKDSYGMHIDTGNKNVVYQYNYSKGNEGGFVEILGENVNVGYRYNISINDGWRTRGSQYGKTFWISGWAGEIGNPIGSDSIFIYNNSIYVSDTITPGIHFVFQTRWTRIYNNIFYVEGEYGSVDIENYTTVNDFEHNIWYGNIPVLDEDGQDYRGENAVTQNPLFHQEEVSNISGIILQPGSPAIGAGKLISDAGVDHPFDGFHNNGGRDYFGNPVSSVEPPNIGAFNGEAYPVHSLLPKKSKKQIHLYPNPVRRDNVIQVEILQEKAFGMGYIQIVDINGKLKHERNINHQKRIRITTDNLPPGAYILRYISGNSIETENILIF